MNDYQEMSYEDFIRSPVNLVELLLEICNLDKSKNIEQYMASTPAFSGRNTQYKNELTSGKIREVTDLLEPVFSELGYSW